MDFASNRRNRTTFQPIPLVAYTWSAAATKRSVYSPTRRCHGRPKFRSRLFRPRATSTAAMCVRRAYFRCSRAKYLELIRQLFAFCCRAIPLSTCSVFGLSRMGSGSTRATAAGCSWLCTNQPFRQRWRHLCCHSGPTYSLSSFSWRWQQAVPHCR